MNVTTLKKKKQEKKIRKDERIIKFYNLLFAIYYLRFYRPTFANLQKWSCLTFYDVKKYLAEAEFRGLIEITYYEQDGKNYIDKIIPGKDFYKFLSAHHWCDRNWDFVKDNLENAKGPLQRFIMFFLAGRVSTKKFPSFREGPVRIDQIVAFLSKEFEFYFDEKKKCLALRQVDTIGFDYKTAASMAKSIREALRQMQNNGVVLGRKIDEDRFFRKGEKKPKHRNEKEYILNITKYSLMRSSYISKKISNDIPLEKDTDICPRDKILKNSKEKIQNKERLGSRKLGEALSLIKNNKIWGCWEYCRSLNPNQPKIFDWLGGALHKFTKRLCDDLVECVSWMKLPIIKYGIFRKLWSLLKEKNPLFINFVGMLIEWIKNPEDKKLLENLKQKINIFQEDVEHYERKLSPHFKLIGGTVYDNWSGKSPFHSREARDNEAQRFLNTMKEVEYAKKSIKVAEKKYQFEKTKKAIEIFNFVKLGLKTGNLFLAGAPMRVAMGQCRLASQSAIQIDAPHEFFPPVCQATTGGSHNLRL